MERQMPNMMIVSFFPPSDITYMIIEQTFARALHFMIITTVTYLYIYVCSSSKGYKNKPSDELTTSDYLNGLGLKLNV